MAADTSYGNGNSADAPGDATFGGTSGAGAGAGASGGGGGDEGGRGGKKSPGPDGDEGEEAEVEEEEEEEEESKPGEGVGEDEDTLIPVLDEDQGQDDGDEFRIVDPNTFLPPEMRESIRFKNNNQQQN